MAERTEDFASISARLNEIVSAVRSKDVSIERSLDLLDEAIELSGTAVEIVDSIASIAGLDSEEDVDPSASVDASVSDGTNAE
ncbi:MAG: exodeoxyribonuclease VII small subunit [Atopobiaceae bacterium]|nr:exodeoxyribonuclease VII small subunit [Atopobiaceae bacterium]